MNTASLDKTSSADDRVDVVVSLVVFHVAVVMCIPSLVQLSCQCDSAIDEPCNVLA